MTTKTSTPTDDRTSGQGKTAPLPVSLTNAGQAPISGPERRSVTSTDGRKVATTANANRTVPATRGEPESGRQTGSILELAALGRAGNNLGGARTAATTKTVRRSGQTVPAVGAPNGPEPAKWSAALAVCLVQATYGLRPPVQLHRWVDQAVFDTIRVKAETAARVNLGQKVRLVRPQVRRTSTFEPARGKVEATVVVACGDKIRSVAIRLEWQKQHWHATALELIQ